MKILFTGASSFTGLWFIQELVKQGHQVTAVFRHPLEYYTGIRKQRVDKLLKICEPVFYSTFGSDAFLRTIEEQPHLDVFCHHAADVTAYRSPNFNAVQALAHNTNNLPIVLKKLEEKGCHKVVLTGSVFEQNEGAGSDALRAVSPYGLSKGLTSDYFHYYNSLTSLSLGKFVIPNPFGPYEEGRFTSYLMQEWLKGKTAAVNTPLYVRDNIHVSLLAKAYAQFVQKKFLTGFEKFNPSGYPESQGAFTTRFATEMRSRLSLPCEIQLNPQKEFPEPKVRINTDVLNIEQLHWNEKQAWDELAQFYQQQTALTNV